MSAQAALPVDPGGTVPLRERLGAGVLGNLARAVLGNRKATAGAVVLAVFVLLALFPGLVARDSPSGTSFAPSLGPSTAHLLGTTSYGQDVFSQLVYGTRESLVIAVVAGLLATTLAILVGVTSAFVGGAFDHVLSLLIDLFRLF